MPEPSRTTIAEQGQELDADGTPILVARHPNGIVVKKYGLFHLPDGQWTYHGECIQWNSEGRLLGSFVIERGNGVVYEWYDNGVLASEGNLKDGTLTGRLRTWDEAGEILSEQFRIDFKRVSKAEYKKRMMSDPFLPQYPETAFGRLNKKWK